MLLSLVSVKMKFLLWLFWRKNSLHSLFCQKVRSGWAGCIVTTVVTPGRSLIIIWIPKPYWNKAIQQNVWNLKWWDLEVLCGIQEHCSVLIYWPDRLNQISATVLSLACRRRHCALAPVLNSQSVQFQCVLVWVYSQQQIEFPDCSKKSKISC